MTILPTVSRYAQALLLFALLPSCAMSVLVESEPPGARINVNGNDTGLVTPASLKREDLVRIGGKSPFKIGVQKDGYANPSPQFCTQEVGVGRIVWTVIFPIPMLPINLMRGGFTKLTPRKLRFVLSREPSG